MSSGAAAGLLVQQQPQRDAGGRVELLDAGQPRQLRRRLADQRRGRRATRRAAVPSSDAADADADTRVDLRASAAAAGARPQRRLGLDLARPATIVLGQLAVAGAPVRPSRRPPAR